MWEKNGTLTVGGNSICTAILDNNLDASQEVRNEFP